MSVSRKRATVGQLAREAGLDTDEALLALWEGGMTELRGAGDPVQRRHGNRARRILGLATRRELATDGYWCGVLDLTPESLEKLLVQLGVSEPYDGGHLCRKAINRLSSVARERERLRTTAEHEALNHQKLVWEPVGHECDLKLLTVDDVRSIHEALVRDFATAPEPIVPAGVRSENLLASAVMRPSTGIGETRKYPTVEMAAAALFHAMVHDHPFHNGNKRTALVSMLVFLDENGMLLTCDEDDLFRIVLQVAQHAIVSAPRSELADSEVLALASWINGHSRWIEKGDRAITWRRFQQILSRYNCTFERAGDVVTVRRRVVRRVKYLSVFSIDREYRAQVHFGGSGREIAKSAVNHVRKELQLDDEHGVDSQAFYEDAEVSTSDFIARYRKTLNRLARL